MIRLTKYLTTKFNLIPKMQTFRLYNKIYIYQIFTMCKNTCDFKLFLKHSGKYVNIFTDSVKI